MSEYKKCNVPTCHNDMSDFTYSCGHCWDEIDSNFPRTSGGYRTDKVSTHIPKHDKRHGPFGKCRVHDCESTAHEQTKLCQGHQGAEKCCFDDCENITHRHWCVDCTEKREHALVIWEIAGSPTYSSRNPNSIEFYNQQLKAKAELQKKAVDEKPDPSKFVPYEDSTCYCAVEGCGTFTRSHGYSGTIDVCGNHVNQWTKISGGEGIDTFVKRLNGVKCAIDGCTHTMENCSHWSSGVSVCSAHANEYRQRQDQTKEIGDFIREKNEKPIPSIKCRCCDNDRVRGSKECQMPHTSEKQATCDVLTCEHDPKFAGYRCDKHQKEYDKGICYEDFMSKFETEEDYRKSQEHDKKKEDMLTLKVNLEIPDIDQEQLKKLGEKVQAAYEQQVRERMQGLQFDFIAPPDFGPVMIKAGERIAAGQAVKMNPDRTVSPVRDEHKHAESCGQMALEKLAAAQASIEEQHQKEVDVRQEAFKKHEASKVDASKFAYFTIDNANTVTVYPNETCMSIQSSRGSSFIDRSSFKRVLTLPEVFVNEKSNEPIKVMMIRDGSRIVITSVLEDGSMRDVVLEYRNKSHECRTFIVSDTIRDAGIGNWVTTIPNWQKHLDEVRENIKNIRASIATKQQEATMSKTNINTLPVIKEDLEDAAWRVAGKQFTKLTRDPIVAAIARGLGEDSEAGRAKVAAFLKTELGTAIYQGMLSTGLSFMPQATGDIPQKMARELRVSAMTSAGDQVADLLMEPLRQVATMYLSTVPQEVPALGQDTTSVKADVGIPVVVEAKR